MFVWKKDDLTDEQENAIREPGNVLLIACPGSGKTRTLTYKIALELSRLLSVKQYVIAITYTNTAAEEIKHRIELLGVNTDHLWIGTIHGFCTEWILRPYGLYHDELKFGFRVFNSHESELMLNEICARKYPHERLSSYDCSYICRSDGYILTGASAVKHDMAETVLADYWQHLSDNKTIDFELILYYSFQILRDHPVVSNTLSQIFSYIMIDEFQDTRELQYQIFCNILSKGNGNVRAFVVGDPNQSIYGTLGGYAIERDILEQMSSCLFEPYELTENFRSSDRIIGYFDYFKTFQNQITGKGRHKDYPSLVTYNEEIKRDGLEDEIVRLILHNIQNLGIAPNEICVAAPQWVHLAALTRNLMAKLPDYSFNGPGMAPFARDIENFFYKLCRILLTEPAPNMYISRIRWAAEVLKELDNAGVNVSEISPKVFLKHCNNLEIQESEGLAYLNAAFNSVFQFLNAQIQIYPVLNNDFNSFFDSAHQRIDRLVREGNQFISTVENFRKVFKQRDGITVSTMHGVKGLEFDTMIAFGLLEDYVPHFNDPDGEISSRKMLYVIASRAKLNLHLISERRPKNFARPPRDMFSTLQLAGYLFEYDVC